MTGLVIGTVLGVVALAWVLAPVARAKRAPRAPQAPPPSDASLDDAAERAIRSWRERTVTCPQCGTRPERDALFCSNCGRYLSAACGRCGAKVADPHARFCPECGESLAG